MQLVQDELSQQQSDKLNLNNLKLLLEEAEEIVIVALKDSSGVSLLDANVYRDKFLDLFNYIQSLKKELD